MSFVKRVVNVQFKVLADGVVTTLDLEGYRVELQLNSVVDALAVTAMHMRIYGMRDTDMSQLAVDPSLGLAIKNGSIIVNAGDDLDGIRQVFSGTISQAFIDYTGVPDVALDIYAVAGGINSALSAAPSNYPMNSDVSTIAKGLCVQMGLTFNPKNNVTVKTGKIYLSGSLNDQLFSLLYQTRTLGSIDKDVLTIWPAGGISDDNISLYSPESGMVGYPTFTQTGIAVRVLFDANSGIGRQVSIKSSIPKANQTWYVYRIIHTLTTLTPDGAWFTDLDLTWFSPYVAQF
jgi:hypothetical protein